MPGTFVLSLGFAFAFLHGQSISIHGPPNHDPFLTQHDIHQAVLQAGNGLVKPMRQAEPYAGSEILDSRRNKWTVECDSEEPNYKCSNAINGSLTSFWQTRKGTPGTQSPDPLPHTITIDLKVIENVNALRMTPFFEEEEDISVAESKGGITGHKVYLSLDNQTWGDAVAFGTWFEDTAEKFANFEPQQARFVRLEATAGFMNSQFISIANLGVWSTKSIAPASTSLGRWGPTIDFPLVPVGVFIDPLSGKVISFSSYAHDTFAQDKTNGTTLTATWDPHTQTVSQRGVRHTKHDMFCPGMSFDVDGRMLISGGATAYKSSIYDPAEDDWKKAAGMNIARGYQGSTTTSAGSIFVIGGSWAPDATMKRGNRNGEIYDTVTDKWTLLEGCPAKAIETTEDWEKLYRADNHVWLQGWKNHTVFHAGPAKDMHWITTTGEGAIVDAGKRGADRDAMCGVAAMYDAVEGKILTSGGAPQYKYKHDNGTIMGEKATNSAFIITLGEVNKTADVKVAGGGMKHQRIFHHAVVLPNGESFVVGGQIEGQAFTDENAQLEPEIYSPTEDKWRVAASHSIQRTYHSFALLLADATVLVGGGGLCAECTVNHFDAQVYIPPYLLTPNGDRAERPVIAKTSAATVIPGEHLIVSTESEIVGASLVRYGGATHSLNNDQRRIELKLRKLNTGFEYETSIPSDGGVAIPGYWMLFVIDALGVPSEAKNVQIHIE